MYEKPKVITIVGPTASGKSGLAIKLAQEVDGEVISADSRQVYRGLDIGTAKVTAAEMQGVPHHLIDVRDVNEVYTGADFMHDATAAINGIVDRDHRPIIAGGTYFYLELLRGRMSPAPVEPNPELRAQLERYSTDQLLTQLARKDQHRAQTIDPHNRRRIIRALEIIEELGEVPPPQSYQSPYEFLIIGIETEKEALRARFRSRAEAWLAGGFQAEVEGLLTRGVSRTRLEEIGFEYTLALELIDGELSPDEFVQKFVAKNWQYAKRQLTWLKRDPDIEWFTRHDTATVIDRAQRFYRANDIST